MHRVESVTPTTADGGHALRVPGTAPGSRTARRRRPGSRLAGALALAVSLIGVVAGPAVTASAAPPAVNPGRPVYLAIGDSLAAGQQSAAPTGSVEETLALWKASGFVAQFHQALRDDLDCSPAPARSTRQGCAPLQVVNIARATSPGVTTATVLQDGDQLDQAIALIEDRNGDRSPRNDVEVISVTLGGNDLYGPAIAACFPLTALCQSTLAAVTAQVAARYDQILAELRAAAGPETEIFTTTYYNPLPFCDRGMVNPTGAAALGAFILEGSSPTVRTWPLDSGFNDMIRTVSARYDAIAVDTFGLLGAGDFVGGADCLHPDLDGHRTIAAAFAAAIPE